MVAKSVKKSYMNYSVCARYMVDLSSIYSQKENVNCMTFKTALGLYIRYGVM